MVYLIVLLAAAVRFVPHLPNAAPLTALAIFAGANLPKKQAIAITLLARLISDVFLGFFAWPLMLAVYACHLAGVLLGMWISRGEGRRWLRIFSAPLFSSGLFFLVTNFAFLYGSYPHNLAGIAQAYLNGLPFFRGTLLGDFGYTISLFGIYQFFCYVRSVHRPAASLA
ncbi:MAG TPA: DUF6580 family putative transport protein [Patescibacteria group bacterium]|nr:DUF6580 family putative transport protein [Patescibacteria group bacterium]